MSVLNKEGRSSTPRRQTILADPTLVDPKLAESTLVDPTPVDLTLADATLVDPTLADATVVDSTLSVNIQMFDNSNHFLTSLECKNHVKYLGVLLDSHLSWKYHIDNVALKISRINLSYCPS